MNEIVKAIVTYCSNYNGCYVTLVDKNGNEKDDGDDIQACADVIINKAYEDCDVDGGYHGDIDELEELAKKTIHEKFGSHVEVEFEEDNIST